MAHHLSTIKDIARVLNISISTVSRALRDTYDVSQKTKSDVLRVAGELNYKPNYNATALAQGKTHNIGVIVPFITNYYFSTVITGIQEIANERGFNIILFVTNDSPERELAVIRNLYISSLDGLLVCIVPDSVAHDDFVHLIEHGTPIVFFDRVGDSIKTSKVMQDDFNGAFEAVEHLISQGYTKIAHIAGPQSLTFTQRREQGYITALKKYGLPVRQEWIVNSGFSQQHGEKDMEQLLSVDDRPDAVFAANDRKAIGAMLTLKRRGIAIGKEIGVIGFTDDPMSSIFSPSLSTMAEPALEIGKEACSLLLKHIHKKHFIAEEKILSGRLIIRESSVRTGQ